MSPKTELLMASALSTEPAVKIQASEEQVAIMRAIAKTRGNILVIARAGSGKTWVIMQCVGLVSGLVAVVAYNNKIAKTIKQKIVDGNHRHAEGGTFHSFGARVLRKVFPNAKVEGRGKNNFGIKKTTYIFKKMLEDGVGVPQFLKSFCTRTLSMAMQQGFGINGMKSAKDLNAWIEMVNHYRLDSALSEDHMKTAMTLMGSRDEVIKEGLRHVHKMLNYSRKLAHEVISYDDMLYLPLLLDCEIPQYDVVFVDEAQDSNPIRIEWAARMAKKTGRFVFVGDNCQAIYGFTGALADATEIIRKRFSCNVYKMTISFRCAKSIARMVQQMRGPDGHPWVPDFKAANDAQEGVVRQMSEDDFYNVDLRAGLVGDGKGDAIICRNTRPLVGVAFNLIRRGTACHIEGKEIGTDLVSQISYIDGRLKNIAKFEKKMDEYLVAEKAKLIADDAEMEAEMLDDKIETLRVIMKGLPAGSSMDDVAAKIVSLFGDGDKIEVPTVALMTAHKSKGLEFRRVFGWGVAMLMPSKNAKQPHEIDQEYNLEYVLRTRAIEEYVDVNIKLETTNFRKAA